ncbi:MAG TPA: hypothetical protein DFS52_09230 [Myxococcales bacterium]|nr:hypothetical protein [Myxococcales bacterium]
MRVATARKPVRAVLTLVVSLGLVAAQLETAAHSLKTTHAFCPEHGEVVDLELGAAALVASEDQGPRLDAGPRVSHHHDHDHCLAALFVRAATAPAAVDLDGLAPPAPLSRRWEAFQGHPSAIPLLHLAPKSSPPSAARA